MILTANMASTVTYLHHLEFYIALLEPVSCSFEPSRLKRLQTRTERRVAAVEERGNPNLTRSDKAGLKHWLKCLVSSSCSCIDDHEMEENAFCFVCLKYLNILSMFSHLTPSITFKLAICRQGKQAITSQTHYCLLIKHCLAEQHDTSSRWGPTQSSFWNALNAQAGH